MEIEQALKKVDWLDEERRKDKTMLASLEERILALEGNIVPLPQQIRDLRSEITRVSMLLERLDQFDGALLQQRIDSKQAVDELDKEIKKREEEEAKLHRVEMRAIEEDLADIRKEVAVLGEIKRGLQARVEEEMRLGRSIDEVRQRIDTIRRSEEEYTRAFRLIEDGRRQDTKRLTDVQGELAALRKNVDEQRGRIELTTTSIRKIETRLNEISVLESERRDEQAKFLDNQAMIQVERERVWNDWQARFEIIERQTSEIESNLQSLDATHRAVKRSQQTLDELSALVERRLTEITEIQRLAEERFRQEWVTFKADDQKRWTNYTLTQEEQRGEANRQHERLVDRVVQIEEMIQELKDLIQEMNEQTENRLQSLLASVHEWVSNYERTVGRMR